MVNIHSRFIFIFYFCSTKFHKGHNDLSPGNLDIIVLPYGSKCIRLYTECDQSFLVVLISDLLVASSRDNETLYIGRVYMYSIATLNTIQTTPVAQGAQVRVYDVPYLFSWYTCKFRACKLLPSLLFV